MKPKIKWAGARATRRPPPKIKLQSGRPRRYRPSEDMLKVQVRPWIPSALTNPLHLAVLRGGFDDFTIAEEANIFLTARDGRRVSREDRIANIANWLNMDVAKLTNWLNRAKRAR